MSTDSDSPIDSEHGRIQAMPGLAAIGGLAASVLGAVLWAAVTVATEFQIGFMAVGMGVLVGFTVRYLGQGGTPSFGILGAVISLFGCLLGNLFSQVGFYATESGQSLIDAWTYLDFAQIPAALVESFHPLDALFYVIALYEGYRFSINKPEALVLVAKTTESNHLASSYPQNKKILAGVALGFFIVSLSVVLYLPNRKLSVHYPSSDVLQWQGAIRWGRANGTWRYWHPEGTQQAVINWKRGFREGPAEFYYSGGSISSEENYLHDLLHGPLRLYSESGTLLSEGQYSYGRMSGLWMEYEESGRLLSKGSYHLDRQTGDWQFWFPGGSKASCGRFEQGQTVGSWEYYHKSGELQRICEYEADGREKILNSWAPEGSVEVEDGNGHYRLYGDGPEVVLLEGPVSDGYRVGSWFSRYPGGSLKEQFLYRGEQMLLVSAWGPKGNQMVANGFGDYVEYDTLGQKAFEAHYDNGRISGAVTTYYPSGNVYQTTEYAEGKPDGMITTYYISGQKEMQGMMDEGTPVGAWKWWHEDGTPSSSVYFEAGKKQGDQLFWEYEELIKIEKYENGELIETELK